MTRDSLEAALGAAFAAQVEESSLDPVQVGQEVRRRARTRRLRHRAWAAGVAVVVGTALGFAGTHDYGDPRPTVADDPADTSSIRLITLDHHWDNIPYAAIRGRLGLQASCLTIDDYLVVWPVGTTVVDFGHGHAQVDLPDGEHLTVGQDVDGGGGGYEVGGLNPIGPAAYEILHECSVATGIGTFVVFFPR